MKYLFLTLIFCSYQLTAQPTNGSIVWKENRKLAFEDFRLNFGVKQIPHARGYADKTERQNTFETGHDAVSSIGIYYTVLCYSANIYYKVEAWFDPTLSYMKYRDTSILDHEQTHFNISELYARKMRHYVKSSVSNKIPCEQLKAALDSIKHEEDVRQDKYDEVYYDQPKLLEFLSGISSEFRELAAFQLTEETFIIK